MANYIIEIKDSKDVSFKIAVTITTSFSGLSGSGSWRAKGDGFICINSGEAKKEPSSGTLTTSNLLLCGQNGTWGIRLNDFNDWLGANDEGSGFLQQSWALALTPGKISWKLVN